MPRFKGSLKGDERLQLIKELRNEVSEQVLKFQRENSELEKEVTELSAQLRVQQEKLDTLSGQLAEVRGKTEEGLQQVEDRIEAHNMHSRKNNLEIHGVFEDKNEDAFDLVTKVAQQLSMRCSASDIVAAHRIPTRKPNGTKPIIVHFVCDWQKEILAAWRSRSRAKKLPATADIGIDGQGKAPNNIYVNEQLTAVNQGLHKRARDLRIKGLKFVWTNAGKVLVRENEQSPIIYVKTLEIITALEEKFKSANPE